MASRRSLLPLAFLGLATLAYAFGQDRFAGVEVRDEKVAGNVHALFGAGGNLGVSVGPDGLLLVDDQFAELAPKIDAALAKLAEGRPRFLVNTHWHGDHTGGNAHFGRESTIVAHANVRRRLADDQESPPEALPVVTYEDGLSIHFNGEEVRLIHVPNAHTDGDTMVWFTGSKVVHLGDLYFDVGYPFVDVSSGGGIRGYVDGLERIRGMLPEGTRVISGHGRVTGLAELDEYRTMLGTVMERVQQALDEGLSVDEVVALKPTEDFDARWGKFDFVKPDAFVRAVATSLSE